MNFFSGDKLTAYEAQESAQWIAHGPIIFQSARALRNLGILRAIEDSTVNGLTVEEIAEKVKLSVYAVRVLLESGLSIGLILLNDKKYTLGKTGYFILNDPLTITNMNFVHDVNYEGFFHLEESIQTGKPVGLKHFGEWETIYEGLSQLYPQVQKSWFEYDHFFSDNAFPLVLPLVYDGKIKNILDIGGNTGKWAIASLKFSPDIHVTIMDLPGQLQVAKKKIEEEGLLHRVSFLQANILDEKTTIPGGFDAIWMSQFLDCFSEKQIESILKKCYQALDENGRVVIMEPFWDKQRFETAAFCLQQLSLYFTVMANGNSQMYSTEIFYKCIENAGFEIAEQTHRIGLSQSILKCKKTQ
jgi:ubiquinone/menaquinone biosynthesis C-methylase UbiE